MPLHTSAMRASARWRPSADGLHLPAQAAPVYKHAYDTSTGVLSKVQQIPLYQNVYAVSANRLYPAISPYAGPLVEKAQPYIDSVFEQLKPITAAA